MTMLYCGKDKQMVNCINCKYYYEDFTNEKDQNKLKTADKSDDESMMCQHEDCFVIVAFHDGLKCELKTKLRIASHTQFNSEFNCSRFSPRFLYKIRSLVSRWIGVKDEENEE